MKRHYMPIIAFAFVFITQNIHSAASSSATKLTQRRRDEQTASMADILHSLKSRSPKAQTIAFTLFEKKVLSYDLNELEQQQACDQLKERYQQQIETFAGTNTARYAYRHDSWSLTQNKWTDLLKECSQRAHDRDFRQKASTLLSLIHAPLKAMDQQREKAKAARRTMRMHEDQTWQEMHPCRKCCQITCDTVSAATLATCMGATCWVILHLLACEGGTPNAFCPGPMTE